MSLFRSDEMGFYHLIASREYAWEILNELGSISSLQFLDLNAQETTFNRPFHNYIKRIEDLEAKINSIENYMTRFHQPITRCEDPNIFLKNLQKALERRNKVERTYLDDVEGEIEKRMNSLTEQIGRYENIVQNYNKLVEYREVLLRTRPYIIHGDFGGSLPGQRRDIQFTYLSGIINREDSMRFRRILFRITRGMTWTALIDFEKPKHTEQDYEDPNAFLDPEKIDNKPKTVFLIVYQGGELGMLKDKLRRICESFGASQYGIPEDQEGFDNKIREVEEQIRDSEGVLKSTRGLIKEILQLFSLPVNEESPYSYIEGLRLFIQKEKTLYHNLNKLRQDPAVFTGNCWCPLDQVQKVEDVMKDLGRRKGDMGSYEFQRVKFPHGQSPPTNFKTNDVSGVFQEIVNTYGVPRYREINPGLFTIVTFPFLFGVMFGDIIHGGLLLLAGLYLIFFKETIEKDKESLWRIALPARYLLALQGFFACYCGFIYNDFTSLSFDIFGTCYHESSAVQLSLPQDKDCTYPFGIDPSWYGTANELTFLNSFKMKLAIVLGVTQMLFGIVLRGLNNSHTKNWLDFCFEFIPMLLFMSLTFGYMVVLIFLKWALPWGTADYPTGSAPSIINIFIKMALNPGQWDTKTMGMPLYGDAEGNFQAKLQLVFLVIALLCALLILLPKPLILISRNKKAVEHHKGPTFKEPEVQLHKKLLEEHEDEEESEAFIKETDSPKKGLIAKSDEKEAKTVPGQVVQVHEEHFEAGEVFVHQVIETIEFVLGSISNTASYLRLWALSLAHSQLAKVFFDNTLGEAIKSGNPIATWVGYWIFANITLGVLLLMDQMECFLHALRLHWVEFQNKFYKADGYAFEPFSYERDLKNAKKEDSI